METSDKQKEEWNLLIGKNSETKMEIVVSRKKNGDE